MKKISKPKLNIFTTIANQLVATACGIVVPRILIGGFGSEAYGVTVSITQFLSYITLLEGGIGGVARAKLYEPLALGDQQKISAVYRAEQTFFRHVALVFLLYSVALGFAFHDLAKVTLYSRSYVFLLVLVISAATLAKYLFGLPNLTLIVADQKQYINNYIMIGTTALNTLLVVLLVDRSCDLLWVKLGSSVVFLVRPILYSAYIHKHFHIQKTQEAELEQKWTGIGQHIAYFLHTNTDVVLLTLFADVKLVAVYAVYNMVISSVRAITQSVSGSMEARFGELIAKEEHQTLLAAYRKYKSLLTAVTLTMFGCTGVLILPFVQLYTKGITDADYIQPTFAVVLMLAEAMNCLVLPCASLPVAANRFRQTRWGAYGEAIINLGLSLVLIHWNPLLGVVLGTLIATLFRALYYMIYSAKEILCVSPYRVLVRFFGAMLLLLGVTAAGNLLLRAITIDNYLHWFLYGMIVFATLAVPSALALKYGMKRETVF